MTKLLLLIPVFAATAWVTQANAVVLLTDNFDTNQSAVTFNDSLEEDQTGTLSPLSWTVSGGTSQTIRQDGRIIMNNQGAGFGGGWASLDYNFATSANAANSPLNIQFTYWADSAAGPSSWVGFGLGANQGAYFFDSPVGIAVTQNQIQTVKVLISNTAGTGSGFNGITNGARVETFINGVSDNVATRTLTANDGFITFRVAAGAWGGDSSWGLGHVDNLSVSLVPEPSTALLSGLGILAMLRRRP
ncbi:MAG: hypothetical protein RLZZ224_1324 [Verrucomicrobiota bacterium]|jgi:hypothetical protein